MSRCVKECQDQRVEKRIFWDSRYALLPARGRLGTGARGDATSAITRCLRNDPIREMDERWLFTCLILLLADGAFCGRLYLQRVRSSQWTVFSFVCVDADARVTGRGRAYVTRWKIHLVCGSNDLLLAKHIVIRRRSVDRIRPSSRAWPVPSEHHSTLVRDCVNAPGTCTTKICKTALSKVATGTNALSVHAECHVLTDQLIRYNNCRAGTVVWYVQE
ncbi:hypothetical protein EVAR_32554_1 [Eumeta japonica]|uniref:Uncharacterized protein n=1 Tax=Eumeta variegata TaxID=151549 RepID=A0A4C1VR12_EUMVA|nr:hypothetical protein EVAR_32554_1 [Eumeta japonica]